MDASLTLQKDQFEMRYPFGERILETKAGKFKPSLTPCAATT